MRKKGVLTPIIDRVRAGSHAVCDEHDALTRFRPHLFGISVGADDVGSDDSYNDRVTAVLRNSVTSTTRVCFGWGCQ
jgi:hypothetical protein